MSPQVTSEIHIIGIPNCVYCLLAKAWCNRWKLSYTYNQLPGPEKNQKYPIITTSNFTGGFSAFVEKYPVEFDYDELMKITRQLTRNLNRVIDKSTYPVETAKRSNTRHRPIGIGVQGLADVFMKMRIGFDSERARTINDKIFETIYYAALHESLCLCKKKAEKKKSHDVKFPGA